MKSDVKFILITIGTVFILVYLLFAGIPFLKKNSSNDDRLAQPEVTSSKENPITADNNSQSLQGNDDGTFTTGDGGWNYNESKDEMRGTIVKVAGLESDNSLNLSAPYNGGSKVLLFIRNENNKYEISFAVENGSFLCANTDNNCYASFKADNGEIQKIQLSNDMDHMGEILTVSLASEGRDFFKKIKTSKRIIVELPFFQDGKRQVTFSPQGLAWN